MILLKFLAAAKDTSIRWNSRLQSVVGGVNATCGLQKVHIHTYVEESQAQISLAG